MTIERNTKNRINDTKKVVENISETSNVSSNSVLKESDQLIKEITKHLPPPSNTRPIFWDIVCSIFEPGVNPGLMLAIHFSFVSLALVHLWLIWLTEGGDWFLWGLLALNVVLYPGLLAFIHLVYKDIK